MINILVVEDDAKLNQIVRTYLNDSRFHAKGCLNAKEAYDEMNNNLYRRIISDIMMPEIDGEEIGLTAREFNIIYKLLSYLKKTFSRVQFMDEFWGVDSDTSLRAVDIYMTKLWDKLSACQIVTVRGLGYKAVLQ